MQNQNALKCTKIICTIGPASNTKRMLIALFDAGMNIIRLNFSHGTHEQHAELLNVIEEIRKETDFIFGVALDTKGPEIRAVMQGEINIKKGDLVKFTSSGKDNTLKIDDVDFDDLKRDYEFTLDDGLLRVKVVDSGSVLVTEALNDHCLKPNKSVNFPGIKLKIPFMSRKDRDDILFGIKHKVDFIFASFVSSTEDLQNIRDLVSDKESPPLIIAKIESLDGVKHIDDIIKASDGIMVARGDLGAELPFEELPNAQKLITKKCKKYGRPVMIATQMLENMITFPVPKRCELTDIANSVLDFADCVMLSAESATGKRPVECVKMMCRIALATEKTQKYKSNKKGQKNVLGSAISELNRDKSVKASLIAVKRLEDITKIYRSQKHIKPIIVLSDNDRILQQLSIYRNVIPYKTRNEVYEKINVDFNGFKQSIISELRQRYRFEADDRLVLYYKDTNSFETIKIIQLS